MGAIIAVIIVIGLLFYFGGKFTINLYLAAQEDVKKRKLENEALQSLKQGIDPKQSYIWSFITFGKSNESFEISQDAVADILNGDWDLVGENENE